MSNITKEAARLMDILPDKDKAFAYEFIKKLVLAWDPDFTKATNQEAARIDHADKSGYVNDEDINWDEIGI